MDSVPSKLRGLFRAVFVHVHSHLRGTVTLDEISKAAQDVLGEMQVDLGPVAWDTAKRLSASEARSQSNCYKPLRLVGYVTELGDVQMSVIPTEDGRTENVDTTCATLSDYEEEPLRTIGITSRRLIDEFRAAHRSGYGVELLGLIVALPLKFDAKRPDHWQNPAKLGFFFHVVDIRRSTSALDMLMATDAERKWTFETLSDLRDKGTTPLAYLRQKAVDNLGIVGLSDFPLLEDTISFVILAAVSQGRVANSSARLHLLIIGPPGQGKKIPSEVAKGLAVKFRALSSGNLSVPGLVGASHRTADGWRSEPGALVRAAHGIASLQDAHGVSLSDLGKIAPVLQSVIEDGTATTSKAGGATWHAPVSLIIDLNRTSHLATASRGQEAPIATLRPLLSRIDLIVEFQGDLDRSFRLASMMMGRITQPVHKTTAEGDWDREARLLVGELLDSHPDIDLSPVSDAMVQRLEQMLETNGVWLERRADAGDFPQRAAVSLARIVAASARACDRSTANESDVDRAFHYVGMKLSYLSHQPGSTNCQTREAAAKQEWFRERYSGRTIRPKDAAREYVQETGGKMDERTARRAFDKLGGGPLGGGLWSLPPVEPPSAPPSSSERVVRVSDCPASDHPGEDGVSVCPTDQQQARTDGQTDGEPQSGSGTDCTQQEMEDFIDNFEAN